MFAKLLDSKTAWSCLILFCGVNVAAAVWVTFRTPSSLAAERGRAPDEAPSAGGMTLLVPSPSSVDLGIVPKGGRKEFGFWLENRGAESVEVADVRTSCECFSVK